MMKKELRNYRYVNKNVIYQALAKNDLEELRSISNFFYNTNGLYKIICNYFAFLYRYDWYVVPEIYEEFDEEEEPEKAKKLKEKILKDFTRILNFLDNSYIRKICGDIALEVIKSGAYYGYIVPNGEGLVIQQLPVEYCRSRYSVGGFPAVEFNMSYFDTFADPNYRMRILKMFPPEFAKGYVLYKQNKLLPDFIGDDSNGWYLLDIKSTVKFSFYQSDLPLFVNAIPLLLDLDAAQDLDRRKQMQKLLKILVQKLPMDKNGDLIFDNEEARDIHNNAVHMLKRAIGCDVLTTFAEIDSIDMSDSNTTTTTDDLKKVERSAFNAFGVSQNLFNTDGNLSLEKSVLNDESSVRNLLLQFSMFFDKVTRSLNKNPKKYNFKLYMLETTQYNYKELSKLYKEQTQIGYSKMLPQIALGHSQSFILNTARFENDVLKLNEIMIPPLMSSTMSSEDVLGKNNETNNQKAQKQTEEKQAGRPEVPNDQKSEKTIKNLEAMS